MSYSSIKSSALLFRNPVLDMLDSIQFNLLHYRKQNDHKLILLEHNYKVLVGFDFYSGKTLKRQGSTV